jgi:SAM-dependent methyltransferase
MNKFELQDKAYNFPYHYIPYLTHKNYPKIYRTLDWGYEYLYYMYYISKRINELNPSNMLDVGCGDGRLYTLINNNIKYTGIDLSSSAINLANSMNPNGKFLNIDVENISSKYDLISLIEVLEHIPNNQISNLLNKILLRIKTGGYLVISVPSINQKLIEKHYRHYNEELLVEQIQPKQKGLKIISSKYIFNKKDIIYRLWKKIFYNKYWFISINYTEKYFWKYINTKNRKTNSKNGSHLFLLLKKTDPEI